jgi:hypothetical protein
VSASAVLCGFAVSYPNAIAETFHYLQSNNAAFHILNFAKGTAQVGVTLNMGATGWSPAGSDSRIKEIQGDADRAQCWKLIRDIEIKRYHYKGHGDRSGVAYLGPMADWLGAQDPELLMDGALIDQQGPVATYNQPLLEMKALAALSEALKRIEILEAKLVS